MILSRGLPLLQAFWVQCRRVGLRGGHLGGATRRRPPAPAVRRSLWWIDEGWINLDTLTLAPAGRFVVAVDGSDPSRRGFELVLAWMQQVRARGCSVRACRAF